MRFMKLLSKILLMLLILSSITGCSNNSYHIEKNGATYYITLGTNTTDMVNADAALSICPDFYVMTEFGYILTSSGSLGPVSVIFNSVEEMAEDISTGNFTEDEIQIIAGFYTDDSGRIPICNPETLYAPIFPDTYDKYRIEWYGERYIAPIYDANSARKGYFVIVEQAPWEGKISELQNYEQTLSSCAQVKHLVAEHNAQNNLSVYWYSKSDGDPTPSYKECVYSFTRGENTYFVREYYTLDTSETIPANIDIYGTAQGQCFYFYINATESRPSIDWLSQFGLKKYIYNSAA